MAEVFYGLGEALIGEGAVGIGVLYLQMALYIEPDHQFALAALANAYEANKQYADAIAVYNRIPNTSPLGRGRDPQGFQPEFARPRRRSDADADQPS